MAGNDPAQPPTRAPFRSLPTRFLPTGIALMTSILVLAACSSTPAADKAPPRPAPHPKTTTTVSEPPTTTTTTPPPPTLSLTVEPADQYEAVVQMVQRAHHSLDMTMYELADPNLELQLVGAWERGVAVRILLDRAGGGASVNQAAFDTLHNRGVPVRWAPGSVDFHQKTLTADQTESAIMTGNLTSSYYPTTRDFVVVDRTAVAVRSIEMVFNHDWNGAPPPRPAGGRTGLEPGRPGHPGRLHQLGAAHPGRGERGDGFAGHHRGPQSRRPAGGGGHRHHDGQPGVDRRLEGAHPGRGPGRHLPRHPDGAVHPRQGHGGRRHDGLRRITEFLPRRSGPQPGARAHQGDACCVGPLAQTMAADFAGGTGLSRTWREATPPRGPLGSRMSTAAYSTSRMASAALTVRRPPGPTWRAVTTPSSMTMA